MADAMCGGCGETDPNKACVGCLHFTSPPAREEAGSAEWQMARARREPDVIIAAGWEEMRPETTSEHIARDMREGVFPQRSDLQMVPVLKAREETPAEGAGELDDWKICPVCFDVFRDTPEEEKAEAALWVKKFKGSKHGGAWIYTHPNIERAVVHNHNGVSYDGKAYSSVNEAKTAALRNRTSEPEAGELKPQVREISETLSAFTVMADHFGLSPAPATADKLRVAGDDDWKTCPICLETVSSEEREGAWGWLFIDDDGLEWSASDPRVTGENQYAENVRPASMEDALGHLIAEIFQPCPESLPEQSSRAAEAMAGQADDAARRQWERRVSTAKDQLADRVRQALITLNEGKA